MSKLLKYLVGIIFLFLICLIFLANYRPPKPQPKITPTVIGNNYRLLIELPHNYLGLSCNFKGVNYSPKLLKIADSANLYEVLLTDLVVDDYTCTLFLKRNDGTKMEMTYYFTIIGGDL